MENCDEHSNSGQTFHCLNRDLGLLDVKQARRLRVPEAQKKSLEKIVTDKVLGIEILQ